MIQQSIDISTVQTIDKPLWWHVHGLSFTRSGYGKRIPTRTMVRWGGKWRRVYCCIFGNSGTCYIETGKERDWIVFYGSAC